MAAEEQAGMAGRAPAHDGRAGTIEHVLMIGQERAQTRAVAGRLDDDIEWREALKASQLSRLKELKFIDSADFLSPLRHLDLKTPVKISFLKGRFAYLLFIRKELEGWIQDDVAETKPPQS